MKVKIVDIHPEDAFFYRREEFIGKEHEIHDGYLKPSRIKGWESGVVGVYFFAVKVERVE